MAPLKGWKRPPFSEEHKKNMSLARKKQWSLIDPGERSKRMSLLAKMKIKNENI